MSRRVLLVFLLVIIILTRLVPFAGELYATCCYPYISYILSFAVSFCPYSLEEWLVILAGVCLTLYPLVALVCGRRLKRIVKGELEMVGWIVVWFYMGWGCNYFRQSFYQRLMLEPVAADSLKYTAFLQEYTDSLNACYLPAKSIPEQTLQNEIKDIYVSVPAGYGLTKPQSFQHPKQVFFNRLYSSVGVLGYMGPFFCESQLNQQLSSRQYPFILAHETAHLLGVSSEAEANFWAYCVCLHSDYPEVRYSGYFGLLPYVIQNTRLLLGEETTQSWLMQVKPTILEEYRQQQAFWLSQEDPTISRLQDTVYDLFLKSNHIETGISNYSEVIGMLMAIRESHEEPLRRQGRKLSVKQ